MSESKPQINVTIQNAGNVNFGSQVNVINAAMNAITEQKGGTEEIVSVFKELTEALLRNVQLQDEQKKELLEVVAELATQAETKSESRSRGTFFRPSSDAHCK